MKEKILQMLAQGLTGSQIASVVGCSKGYIVQLAGDEDNKKRVMELRNEYVVGEDKDGVVLSNKYNGLEHELLKEIGSKLGDAELPALTNTLKVIAERQEKRLQRLAMPLNGLGGANLHVHLTLPSHATLGLPSFQLNENKEVISIAGKPMAPMSSEGVKTLFNHLAAAKSGATVVEDLKTIEMEREVDISGEEF